MFGPGSFDMQLSHLAQRPPRRLLYRESFIQDYSAWTAKLYEMLHEDFSYDPAHWTCIYHKHPQDFKVTLFVAFALYFP